MTEYFKLRYKRNLEGGTNKKIGHRRGKLKSPDIDIVSTEPGLPPPKRFLALDSTSISTYSETISEAAYGYAKQNPELKQVNFYLEQSIIPRSF